MNRMIRVVAIGLLASTALSGCAVGPNFERPAPPTTTAYAPTPAPTEIPATPGVAGGQAQRFVAAQGAPDKWWTQFGSPQLNAMVDEALAANPDLKSADAALRQADALMKAQAGAELPTANFGYTAERDKTSNSLSPVPADNAYSYSLHTAQITVGYTVDVFGGLRRATEQAAAQADQARWQYEAARATLIANVVAAAVQSAALGRQVEAARQTAAAARQELTLMQRQVQLGEVGQADVAAQQAQVAQADQALSPLAKSLGQQQSALAVLLGREAGQGAPPPLDLDALVLPPDLPVSAPADLVRRRPDIVAAEANLHAASAGVGVAVAARLPNFTLSAAGGGASNDLRNILNSGNDFWTLSAGVAQPIFEGGQLLQKQKAAEAALDQAKAQYRSSVLNALKNVADSLDALTRDAETLKAASVAEAASRRSLTFAQKSRDLGETGALQVLTAEQTYAQARATLVAASAARFADTAALYQSLGGAA
ncbi:MAG TPA: efflux transporter outer membrane subunit [Caulobacteraceae bacterium]|nr:efflux transporter outer membrane subunit [Caulobacteraceae bacterium]